MLRLAHGRHPVAVWGIVGSAFLMAGPGRAAGQNVLSFGSNWTNFDGAPFDISVSQYTTNEVTDTGFGQKQVTGPLMSGTSPSIQSGDLLRLRLRGFASRDSDEVNDTFNLELASHRNISLNRTTELAIPTHLDGLLKFIRFGGNFGTLNATLKVQVATTAFPPTTLTFTRSFDRLGTDGVPAPGQFEIPNPIHSFDYFNTTLNGGSYDVRVSLQLKGDMNVASFFTNAIDADFYTNPIRGLSSSITGVPTGLTSSRVAVNAPAARNEFGVTGQGVGVGILEIGRPYTTHDSLAGAITQVLPAGGGATIDQRSEHSLAVAGIIASDVSDGANAGIAPGSQILAASRVDFPSYEAAARALVEDGGAKVINASLGADEFTVAQVNQLVRDHRDLTFVKSSGNVGINAVSSPGLAANIITVGAVNGTFERRADFSSYNDGLNFKPDLVAPGEYIKAPSALDTNGDGLVNDYQRTFLGDGVDRVLVQVGEISGTSFAAPHVAGAAALLNEYQVLNADHHLADHRVIKAVLLNGASISVKEGNGAPWSQPTTGSLSDGTYATFALNPELGAGLLDVRGALRQYRPNELNDSHANAAKKLVIDTPFNTTIDALDAEDFNAQSVIEGKLWDFERVAGAQGTVDYLLGDISEQHMRVTMTWDEEEAGLAELVLGLYHEGAGDNPAGSEGGLDVLIASSRGITHSVNLFDFTIPDFGQSDNEGYYLQVLNRSAQATDYAIAVSLPAVPEPGTFVLFAGLAFSGVGRRRRHAIP